MPYRLLGDVGAGSPQAPIDLGGTGQRATLAMLLMNPKRYVPDDRLAAGVGADGPVSIPSLRTFVSGLRRVIGPVVERRGAGYVLDVDEAEIDLSRFRLAVRRAREAVDSLKLETARDLLHMASDLWRNPALGGLERTTFYRTAGPSLSEERSGASDLLFNVDLALGHHERCLPDLWDAMAEEPLRERRCGQLMLALYRAGRQAEAVKTYSQFRHRMIEELGLDPGPELRRLESQILASSESLDWVPPRARAAESRATDPPSGLICRHRELEGLQRFAQSSEGRGLAIVRGEAGMGKSMLLGAFMDLMRRRGAIVLSASCEPGGSAPFGVVRKALDGLDHLATSSRENMTDLAVVFPGMGGSLDDGSSAFVSLSGTRVVAAAGALLADAARAGPKTVLVIEDMQWAEATTMAFVEHVVRSAAQVLVVLSSRAPIDRLPALPMVELDLRALDEAGTNSLWAHLAGRPAGPSEIKAIHATTGGVPFYIAALASSAAEREGTSVHTATPMDLSHSHSAILDQRLMSLGTPVRELLAATAVAGPPVRLYELAALTDHELGEVVEILQPAVEAGVLLAESNGQFQYDFTHDLIRDHIAASVPPAKAALLHVAAAAAISNDAGSQSLLRRWRHLTQAAGLVSPAELLDAAQSAFAAFERVGAVDEATDICLSTLDITGDAFELASEMLVRLAVLLGSAGRAEAARAMLNRGALAARASGAHHILIEVMRASDPFDPTLSGDPQRAATVREALDLLGDSPTQTRVTGLVALSVAEHRQGRSTNARALLDEAALCANALGTPAARGLVGHLRHLLDRSLTSGRLDEGKRSRETASAIDLAVRAGDLGLIIATTADALTDALEFGSREQALTALQSLRSYAEQAGKSMARWAAACAETVLAQGSGELDRAEQLARTAVALGREQALGLADVVYDAHRLVNGLLRGDLSDLHTSLASAVGRDQDAPAWLFAKALALSRSGNLEGARHAMESAGGVSHLPDDWLRPAGLMLAGEATALAGGPDDPELLIASLRPWLGSDLVIGTAMVSLGPVQRVTGLLQRAVGASQESATDLVTAAERSLARGMRGWARLALADGLPQALLTEDDDLIARGSSVSAQLSPLPPNPEGQHS